VSNNVVSRRVKWSEMHDLPNNPINLTRIMRIENDGGYKVELVGTPEVALNDARAFPDLAEDAVVLIDGHHRKTLALRAKRDDDVICKVHRGLERPDVEQRYLAANDYRTHHPNELFVHRVAAGEIKARAINKIIEQAGFHVAPHGNPVKDGIRGANAVEWVYDGGVRNPDKYHAAVLTRTLEGLRLMYSHDEAATKSNLVKGLGLFHLRYANAVDLDRLHKNVPAKYRSVAALLADADMFKDALRYQVPHAVAYTIRLAYNGGRRSKRDLPEWR
jgi:hypothetical protein